MNLILFFGISIWGLTAFIAVAVVCYIIDIITNLVYGIKLIDEVLGFGLVIYGVLEIVILFIFWKMGFPLRGILITNTVMGIIGGVVLSVMDYQNQESPVFDIIRFVILNVIGIFLFIHNEFI